MQTDALSGGFADPPVEAARAFRACLEAMARPGRLQAVAGAAPPAPLSPAAGAVLLTLVDAETPLHLAPSHDTDAVRAWIAFHTGAPLVGRGEARFALGDWAALLPLGDYPLGTPEYPDRSATLIVEVAGFDGPEARLTGPGIETAHRLALPETAASARTRGASRSGSISS